MLNYLGLLAVIAASICRADCITPRCQKIDPKYLPHIDLNRLQGTWHRYAMASDPFNIPLSTPCNKVVSKYDQKTNTLDTAGFMYKNRNSPISPGFSQNVTHAADDGLDVSAFGWDNKYFTLVTDYDHYVVAYTCVYVHNKYHETIVYIAGRTPEYNEENFQMAVQKLKEIGVPPQNWNINTATDC